jgi:hypothetical protein
MNRPALLCLSLAVLLAPTAALANGLGGAWTVTATPSGINTCPANAKIDSAGDKTWVVKVEFEKAKVTIDRDKSFNKVGGKLEGNRWILTGGAKGVPVSDVGATTVIAIAYEEGSTTFSGEQYVLIPLAKGGGICMATFMLAGKRGD